MIKVKTNQRLNTGDSLVKVQGKKVRIVFDKFTRSKFLTWVSPPLYAELDWKGISKKIKGDFGVFIIKKKKPGKWPSLECAIEKEEKNQKVIERNQEEENQIRERVITEEGDTYDLQNLGTTLLINNLIII